MTSSLRAGVVAIAAIAIGIGLSGCGSDTKSESTTSKETTSAAAAATTTTSKAAPAPPPPDAAGPNKTIVDYIKENGIVETPVQRGDAGSPTIDLPFPPGWEDAGNRKPAWAYGAIVFSDPAMAQNPPTIIALVSKLAGNVDPAKILEYAPGEIRNLPGYEGATAGTPSTLSGFEATQIGGMYVKDGVKRAIAQKTVVIPGQDGLYVLQLNADGTEDQMGPLMDATNAIDEQTKITT
jgi:Probable lipoprotein LpqN